MTTENRKDADTQMADPRRSAEGSIIKTPLWLTIVKWAALALTVVFAAYLITVMLPQKTWLGIVLVSAVAMGAVVIYATRRHIPAKYLYPGLLLLLAFQVWPIIYTVSMSTTNYGDGHMISKQDAITSITASSVEEVPGSQRYKLSVAVPAGSPVASGEITYLLVDKDGKFHKGTPKGLEDMPADGVKIGGTAQKIIEAPGYTVLKPKEQNQRKDLATFAVPTDNGAIKSIGLSEAFEGKPTITYDKAADTLTDKTGKVYHAKGARFIADDGTAMPTGWKENVGGANFSRFFSDQTLRAGFLKIFLWNLTFAVVSVASTFLLGMALALMFNSDRLRAKGLWRALVILPYAVPGFITPLVWMSMYNPDYGLINRLLHLDIDWYSSPFWAKVSILVANLWLGFPYMFIVCTGALQAIPGDVMEAAKMDGASRLQTTIKVVMPLLLVAVSPLLVASFAFNFNNFNAIELLTEGGPFAAGEYTRGGTDILISMIYRQAFGGSGADFGFASAMSVALFVLTGALAALQFKFTSALEDVN